jgi:hypothetical protein
VKEIVHFDAALYKNLMKFASFWFFHYNRANVPGKKVKSGISFSSGCISLILTSGEMA